MRATPTTRTVRPYELRLFETWAGEQDATYILNKFTRTGRYADAKTRDTFEGFMGMLVIARAIGEQTK